MEQSSHKILLPLTLVILMLGLAVHLATSSNPSNEPELSSIAAEDDVLVEDTIATSGMLEMPQGFPSDIPVDEENLLESFKVTRRSQALTHYVLKYSTSASVEDVWAKYQEFMNTSGYNLSPQANVVSGVSIFGTKEEDALSVDISTEADQTIVRLNYYER